LALLCRRDVVRAAQRPQRLAGQRQRGHDRAQRLPLLALKARGLLERVLAALLRVLEVLGVAHGLRDDLQDRLVLPEAEEERGQQCDDREDQPLAQLVEVIDERQAVFVTDWAQPFSHVRRVLLARGSAARAADAIVARL